MKRAKWALWEKTIPRGVGINLIRVDHFDAHGMRRVYGRGDHFGRCCTFNMDVWLTRSGRLLARFWSRSSWVEEVSLEVIGLHRNPPLGTKATALHEGWVPRCLRDEYDNWIDQAEIL
ncbi:MAG: hypothetical protein WAO35_07390 [Terriglobia bacterium]